MPESFMTLAAEAVSMVAPYLAATRGAAEAGESGGLRAAELWREMRLRLGGKGATSKLKRFEAAPDSGDCRSALVMELEEALAAEPEWRSRIEQLLLQPPAASAAAAEPESDGWAGFQTVELPELLDTHGGGGGIEA